VLAGNFVLSEPAMAIGFLHDTLGLMSDATAANAIDFLSSPAPAFRWIGALFGLIITANILWTFSATRERVKHEVEEVKEKKSFKEVLIQQYKTLQDKPFRILIIATLVADINTGIVLSTFPYALEYWLKLQDYFAVLFLIVIVMQIFFGFGWVWLSKRKGKKFVFLAAQFVYGVTFMSLYFMQPGKVIPMLIIMLFVSLALAGYLMVWSIIADIVDYDEYKTHKRREGAFYSFYTLTNKVATAIGIFFVGLFLSAVGMEGDFTMTPTMVFWLKMFLGPFVGLLNVIGFIIFLFFPYNREEHQQIQAELEERKADI
jgi:Na+/melibiose symporter-like transporter